jgi:hypothetical protein
MARRVEKIIKRRPEEVGKRAFKAGDHGFCGDKEIRKTDKNSQLENSGSIPTSANHMAAASVWRRLCLEQPR